MYTYWYTVQVVVSWFLCVEGLEMEYITLKNMVGSNIDRPCIDAKAMQSRMLCMFARWFLQTRLQRFRSVSAEMFGKASGLLKSADCLKEWYNLVHGHGPKVPDPMCKHAVALAKKHIVLWVAHSGSDPKPKHHAFFEMSRAIQRAGNPKDWTTHSDETLNSTVARLARTVHTKHFALSVLKNNS